MKKIPVYLSEALATIIFIAYCYFGASILAEYVFEPIISKLRAYVLIVALVIFFAISYVINNHRGRNMFLQV